MALSMSGHPVFEQIQTVYGPPDIQHIHRSPPATASKPAALDASMRSDAMAIRRREFQVDDWTRRVPLIERMIADFEARAVDLDREILIEQERAGINDPAHFAYPTYAKAAILRRDNLKHSADELRTQLAKANDWLKDAYSAISR